jgi:hypothetical protein
MMATARVNVNRYPGLLDEAIRLCDPRLDTIQRQGLRGFGYDGQTDSGDSGTA